MSNVKATHPNHHWHVPIVILKDNNILVTVHAVTLSPPDALDIGQLLGEQAQTIGTDFADKFQEACRTLQIPYLSKELRSQADGTEVALLPTAWMPLPDIPSQRKI